MNAVALKRSVFAPFVSDIPRRPIGNVICIHCHVYCGGLCPAARRGAMAKLSLDVAPDNLATIAPVVITKQSFVALLEEHEETCAKFAQIEAKKKQQAETLKTEWLAKHGPKLETDDYLCTQVFSHSAMITPDILAKLGVKATIIEKAKALASKPYSYAKVTRKKDPLAETAGAELRKQVKRARRSKRDDD